MKIFKFGGASVQDANGVENLGKILKLYPKQDLVLVISAMGKTTNALEKLVHAYRQQEQQQHELLEEILSFHRNIARRLDLPGPEMANKLEEIFEELKKTLANKPSDNYDFDYDQIVCFGELMSTTLIGVYLKAAGLENEWCDARTLIRTDRTFREGKIEWDKTIQLIRDKWHVLQEKRDKKRYIMLTQGFIGHTAERNTTTLGREGSDFTASIMAYALDADSMTIWKDVPGVLNADPKFFSDVVKLKRISYKEAIELAYYGASVIHPKTIKPIQNKQIVLHVKSFLNPEEDGTVIDSSTFSDSLVPSYIFKVNQALISFTPRDFSFIAEENLSELFGLFSSLRVKINLMQNSAINFSICIDHDPGILDGILKKCQEKYEMLYNLGCELVTIRHYDQETIRRLLIGKKVLVEQRSRNTARMVLGA